MHGQAISRITTGHANQLVFRVPTWGLAYMTSVQKGGGGPEITQMCEQTGQGGQKTPKMLWMSYMEAPWKHLAGPFQKNHM